MRPLVAFSLLAISGCATIHSRPLTSLPIDAHQSAVAHSTRRIVLGPFVDARGDQFARIRALPVVGIFHRSAELYYPEVAGELHGYEDHHAFVTTGSLDGALPSMLAQTMQQMQLAPSVALASDGRDGDYFVTGKLVRSALRHDTIPIAAWVGGLLGVPFAVTHFELAYEVAVYDVKMPTQPLFVRTYEGRGKRVQGLYYNHDSGYALLLENLKATLPEAVRDISRAIANHEGAMLARIDVR